MCAVVQRLADLYGTSYQVAELLCDLAIIDTQIRRLHCLGDYESAASLESILADLCGACSLRSTHACLDKCRFQRADANANIGVAVAPATVLFVAVDEKLRGR